LAINQSKYALENYSNSFISFAPILHQLYFLCSIFKEDPSRRNKNSLWKNIDFLRWKDSKPQR